MCVWVWVCVCVCVCECERQREIEVVILGSFCLGSFRDDCRQTGRLDLHVCSYCLMNAWFSVQIKQCAIILQPPIPAMTCLGVFD